MILGFSSPLSYYLLDKFISSWCAEKLRNAKLRSYPGECDLIVRPQKQCHFLTNAYEIGPINRSVQKSPFLLSFQGLYRTTSHEQYNLFLLQRNCREIRGKKSNIAKWKRLRLTFTVEITWSTSARRNGTSWLNLIPFIHKL